MGIIFGLDEVLERLPRHPLRGNEGLDQLLRVVPSARRLVSRPLKAGGYPKAKDRIPHQSFTLRVASNATVTFDAADTA
jgi:hypothetical protein